MVHLDHVIVFDADCLTFQAWAQIGKLPGFQAIAAPFELSRRGGDSHFLFGIRVPNKHMSLRSFHLVVRGDLEK